MISATVSQEKPEDQNIYRLAQNRAAARARISSGFGSVRIE
jgi:hypothetical protein